MTISPALHPLSCLLGNSNSKSLAQVKQELMQRGWCFLAMDNESAKYFDIQPKTMGTLYNSFAKWMKSPTTKKDEYRHVKYPENRFGYFSTSRKEGFRFMTGDALPALGIENEVTQFKTIAETCDKLAEQMMSEKGCGKFLFNVTDVNDLKDLPLLRTPPQKKEAPKNNTFLAISPEIQDTAPVRFGLFDIVKYHSSDSFSEKFQGTDSQVNEHADPGLFSISFGSTSAGLEMFDPTTEEWIDVANDTIVLWCGNEVTKVSNGTVKPGIHRVKASKSERVTAWYELCTKDQIPDADVANIPEKLELELLKRIEEEDIGVSMSKSGIRRVSPVWKMLGLSQGDVRKLRKNMSKLGPPENDHQVDSFKYLMAKRLRGPK